MFEVKLDYCYNDLLKMFSCQRRTTIKILEIGTTKIVTLNVLKIEHCFFNVVMGLKDADGMTNSVDPDQTALGAV